MPQSLNTFHRALGYSYEGLRKSVKIVMVGKYTGMSDAYASVNKALLHSCLMAGFKLDLQVCKYQPRAHPQLQCLRVVWAWIELKSKCPIAFLVHQMTLLIGRAGGHVGF